jgi:hypothetical protein
MAAANRRFAVCVDNADYTAALEVRKIYQVLPDAAAAARSYLRIIDESGEDYLYPRRMFLPVNVRPEARARLAKVLSHARNKTSKPSSKAHRRIPSNRSGKNRRLASSKR